ncbi:hypothetical protein [Sulfurimonas sp. C5]|uniref:hypothetical protein n=1 Tax=Sulfurimonas sp. C5 TaxID=3036947 RepID=UPI00245789E5|nr:hypothetical protein [Sulfurimonas sp. C5]MDH4944455.1 hypothetical protein [Sulfurimonas sp. C5]
MNEALVKLREIGAQKIYEKTHIPVEHVQAILHESYDGLNKVQFIGFISILEREYGLELKAIKLKGITYFDGERKEEIDESIFINTKPKKSHNALYIIIAVIVFLIFLFVFYNDSKEAVKPAIQENEIIQKVKEKVVEEVNNTAAQETNETVAVTETLDQNTSVEEEQAIEKSFVIKTNTKLWIGYIELETNKKNQTVVSKEFSLDPNIDWLITLGHGYVDFEVNGKEYSYKTEKGLKFLYQDGELKPISFKEFKRLNRGYVW